MPTSGKFNAYFWRSLMKAKDEVMRVEEFKLKNKKKELN